MTLSKPQLFVFSLIFFFTISPLTADASLKKLAISNEPSAGSDNTPEQEVRDLFTSRSAPSPPESSDDTRLKSAPDFSLVGAGETNSGTRRPSEIDLEDEELEEDEVVGKGDRIIWNDEVVQIHGKAFLKYQNIVLHADHVWANFDTNILKAEGNVYLKVGEEDTHAEQLVYNLESKKGLIRNGVSYDEPWYYQSEEILKVDEDESLLNIGSLTTCSLKYPHYYFEASKIFVKIDKELLAKHVVLKIGGIPLLYLPVYRRDLREEKPSRVIVKIGTDSYLGHYLSIILPIVRKRRLRSKLLYDWSSRRGSGGGTYSRYYVRDVKFKEIKVPIPADVALEEKRAAEAKAKEIADRLQGKYDKYHLKQIFLKYKIDSADVERARTKAEEVYSKLVEGADFAKIAQQNSDDRDTKYQGGDMGFWVQHEGVLSEELEKVAFQLKEGEISDIIQTDAGYNILKIDRILDCYGAHEVKVRRILIAILPSDGAKKEVQLKANDLIEQLKAGTLFSELATAHSNDLESKKKGGDIGWIPLNKLEKRSRYAVRKLKPNEVSRLVGTDKGIQIYKLIEKEPTPTFEEVEEMYSEELEALRALVEERQKGNTEDTEEDTGKKENEKTRVKSEKVKSEKNNHSSFNQKSDFPPLSGDRGGANQQSAKEERGFRGAWEATRPVARQAQMLDYDEVSDVIESKEGYHIIKVQKKRTFNGDFRLYTSDLYSYSLTDRKDTFKTGRRWDFRLNHRHIFYTPWDDREARRNGLTFMGKLTLGSRDYKEGYGESRSELRSYGVFTWGSAFSAMEEFDTDEEGRLVYTSNVLVRLAFDKTVNLVGEGFQSTQKLPELFVSWSGLRVDRLPLLKTINSQLTKIARKTSTDKPILSLFSFPTLDNIRLDIDSVIGNYYRSEYRDEKDIYLQTADIGFDLRKQSKLNITKYRELMLELRGQGNIIWHDINVKKERNIFKSAFSTQSSIKNSLFRVYDIGFIPNARKLRHQIFTTIRFDYTPPVTEESDLYPFGPSAYYYEKKTLGFDFRTNFDVKTRRNEKFTFLNFNTGLTRDFTEYEYETIGQRKYDFIRSRLTITPFPSRKLRISINTTHDPNEREDGTRFKQIGFRSSLSYSSGSYRKGWSFNIGNSYSKLYTSPSRYVIAGFDYRPNRLFQIDVDVQYDWIKKQFYSQSITIKRNLHCWDLRLSWRRLGIKRPPYNNIRQEFTFQINLISDPTITMGMGYDATTKTWGIQSLPVGIPYDTFAPGGLGRSYF